MKVYVVVGINNILNIAGPVGVALTEEGRDKVLKEQAYCCDSIEAFELQVDDELLAVGGTSSCPLCGMRAEKSGSAKQGV